MTRTVELVLNSEGTGFLLAAPGTVVELPDQAGGGLNRVELFDASGEFDPVLNLAVGVTDAGAPSTFAFSLASPLIPTLFGPVTYTIDFDGTFTDGASDGGSIAVSAAQTFGVMDVSLNGTDIDGLGGAAAFAGPINGYGPFATAAAFNCGGGGCTSFGITFGFDGSGNNDTYALNGRFEVVPEPSTLALVVLGLGALAQGGRLRRS